MSSKKSPRTLAEYAPTEARVDVTVIAKGLVRLDVYDERGQGSVVLTHDEAKKIAVALSRA